MHWDPDDGPEVLHEVVTPDLVALGVAGGDGTCASVAGIALEHDLPLAVFPAGTLNHFAKALGLTSMADTAAAVEAGTGGAVDVARVETGRRFSTPHPHRDVSGLRRQRDRRSTPARQAAGQRDRIAARVRQGRAADAHAERPDGLGVDGVRRQRPLHPPRPGHLRPRPHGRRPDGRAGDLPSRTVLPYPRHGRVVARVGGEVRGVRLDAHRGARRGDGVGRPARRARRRGDSAEVRRPGSISADRRLRVYRKAMR